MKQRSEEKTIQVGILGVASFFFGGGGGWGFEVILFFFQKGRGKGSCKGPRCEYETAGKRDEISSSPLTERRIV